MKKGGGVTLPATHPLLQLAPVQMFSDEIYFRLLIGYFLSGITQKD